MQLLRLVRILLVALRHGLIEMVAEGLGQPVLARCARVLRFSRPFADSRGARIRLALEELGPIFVKFGQVLSTRRDLLPTDVADELARLQDRVPPFDSAVAMARVEAALGRPLAVMFQSFERTPVASASIAQVHFAVLHDGREVAVKVLRPGMLPVIDGDIALMRSAAHLLEMVSADGRRLKPREVVAEFDTYLHDELDLMREAANASQLRRNFQDSALLRVPEMYWDYCAQEVIVMERMHGIPISQIDRLRAAGIDLKKLSRDGVEIFFTQVFRDGFFHADMHPGNIYVGDRAADFNRYIALDFGIVGTLTDNDKNYLAQNFLAFFRRDYKRVATLHIESGWVPPETREDELESAIRACCEPIFDRPLSQISFGQVLLRLFQTSRRFNVEVQPQLVLLQKTLLNIEGLGRQLDPELDLWKTARPFLERWMGEQIGLRGLWGRIRQESTQYAQLLPQLPRLAHTVLSQLAEREASGIDARIARAQARTNRLLTWLLIVWVSGFVTIGVLLVALLLRL